MNQYYEVLGIKKGATDKEIKSAYRNMSKKFHPDVNPSDEAKGKMVEINEAYGVLSGKIKPEPEPTRNPFSHGHRPGAGHNPFGGFNRRKGNTIQIVLSITLEEVFSGVDRDINFKRNTTCGDCGGAGGKDPKVCPQCSGQGMYRDPHNTMGPNTMIMCHTCGGSGQVLTQVCGTCNSGGSSVEIKKVTVTVPKGATHGNLVMRGVGNEVAGGDTGDVVFVIKLIKHKIFEVDGMNLHKDENVNVIDLILGTTIEFNTLDGKVKMDIPKLCDTQQAYRLKQKGLVNGQTGMRGDMYVNIITKMPETLSEEQEEMLKKLKEEVTVTP